MTTLLALVGFVASLAVALPQAIAAGPQCDLVVSVRVVDPHWRPVPGTRVALQEQGRDNDVILRTTNEEGLAHLTQPFPDGRATFDLAVSMPGFQAAGIRDVRFGSCVGDDVGGCCAPRYMQVQLEAGAAGYLTPVRP